ncbi:MAG: DUF6081 family protein [Pseudonocardiaceae bacterium]
MTSAAALVCAAVLLPAGPAAADATGPSYRMVWDDFRDGFSTSGPNARWSYITVGPYVADDGNTTTSRQGLRVVSSGRNPDTGKPAFVHTVAQEEDNGRGLPGTLDHVKWLTFTNHTASTGYPGFDAEPGQKLSCETWISGRTYGVGGHPFGDQVANPETDLRLASVSMNTLDPETSTVFNFLITNEQIYAFYERLPNMRTQLGNYAAFSYAIPVADRSPHDRHHLQITYDRSAGVTRWLVDGNEVYQIDRLGHRLASREYLLLDHGGEETSVQPRQLNCGMGMLSILDGELPGQSALVRLSSADGFYFDPPTGEPDPQTFLDGESLESNRLFGQGAGMSMSRYVVSSAPADHK